MISHSVRWLLNPKTLIRGCAIWAVAAALVSSSAARGDQVLVSVYSFSGTGSVDLIDPSTGLDTGPYISGLNSPSGVAIGTDGSIYVAEQGTQTMPGDVQHYTASGAYLDTLPLPADAANGNFMLAAGGVRVGPNGNVYATDYAAAYRPYEGLSNTGLFQFSGTDGSFVSSVVANMTSGVSLAFDNAGNVYVADFGTQGVPNGQIIKYNAATQTQTTIIASGSGPSDAPLQNPDGVLLLPNGNLLVGDLQGSDLLQYTTSGAYVAPFVLGANQPALSFPGGLQFTPNGQDILVANLGADFVNGSVAEFDLNGNLLNNWSTGLASDVAVLTSPAVTWNAAASNYSSGSNWSTMSAPNAAGANATFGAGSGTLGATTVVTVDGQFTVGTLAFNNASTQYILQSADGSSSITLNNNGLGGLVSVPAGGQTHTIDTTLILDDIGSTGFNIGTGSTLNINGTITGSGALALTGGGNLSITGGGSISNGGGTTIENGQLQVSSTGSISGALTLMVAYGYNGELDLAAAATTLSSITSSTDSVSGTTATVNTATGSALATYGLNVSGTLNLNSGTTNTGSMTVNASPTFADGAQLNVNGGTVRINSETTGWSVGSNVAINVAPTATLQLALSRIIAATQPNASSSSPNLVTINNHGSLGSSGGLYILNSSQSVGLITGTAVPDANGATVYDGDTVVGTESQSASLTATQILQNSLTINNGSSVTIVPSSSGSDTAAVDDDSATSDAVATSAPSASVLHFASDASAAIQAAIDSGSISATTGKRFQTRILAIERLAAENPEANVAAMEESLLDLLATTMQSPPAGLSFGSSSSSPAIEPATIGLSSNPGLSSGTAAVPEPSTFVLAAATGICLTIVARRRRAARL
jgi:fibronectin-binding autotransporter adhesin